MLHMGSNVVDLFARILGALHSSISAIDIDMWHLVRCIWIGMFVGPMSIFLFLGVLDAIHSFIGNTFAGSGKLTLDKRFCITPDEED